MTRANIHVAHWPPDHVNRPEIHRRASSVTAVSAGRDKIDFPGLTTQPEFAWWFDDAGWTIENRGAEPDIEVEFAPHDYAAGRDPQLERAVAELVKLIPDQPKTSKLEPRPSRALRTKST